jgi:predicted Zn-dependent protease
MKRIAFVLLLVTLRSAAQTRGANQGIPEIERACGGAFMTAIDSSDEMPLVKDLQGHPLVEGDPLAPTIFANSTRRIMATFKWQFRGVRVMMVLASSAVINAWAIPTWGLDAQGHRVSLVCVPTAFVDFMTDEDELAFMLAHELGHTVDEACRLRTQYTRENQTVCETRADEIGLSLLERSNYSPYAAAGAFGRYEMYSGDTQTGILGTVPPAADDSRLHHRVQQDNFP